MSLWQFSESSQPLLKRCLEAATRYQCNENKWIQKFGSKRAHLIKHDEVSDSNTVDNPNNISNGDTAITSRNTDNLVNDEKSDNTASREKEELWREILDLEPIAHFDYMVEKCLENTDLYLLLAKELPIVSIEKLCKYVYDTKDINSTFLEKFYMIFFPVFLKREPTRLSLDLLVKAKCNSVFFKHLLVVIIKDIELPSTILHDFVATLDINERTQFLLTLCQFDIPKEVFIYHLASLHNVYKNSQKNCDVQNYILTKLTQISESCITNKNYGRFLLNFLQSHKNYKTNITEIEYIIDTHRSAFKKPCLNVLNEIKNIAQKN